MHAPSSMAVAAHQTILINSRAALLPGGSSWLLSLLFWPDPAAPPGDGKQTHKISSNTSEGHSSHDDEGLCVTMDARAGTTFATSIGSDSTVGPLSDISHAVG
jgi:hypothetical protein